jgi:hypothetical protein
MPEIIIIVNDLEIGDDGWAQVAPLGDFPGVALIADASAPNGWRKVGAIQRIDTEAVNALVSEFQEGRKGLKRFLTGRPIFHGHPDVAAISGKYPDKTAKGVIADLVGRDRGLYALPVFNAEGMGLVESKKARAFSARFAMEDEPIGTTADGKQIYRPKAFLSVGLTNQPNLPVQFMNEEEEAMTDNQNQTEGNTMKKEKIIAWLTKRGVTIANDATDEQLESAMEGVGANADKSTTFANDKATLDASIQQKDTTITTLTTERNTARTQFANERAARIDGLIGRALKDGRITGAEEATWRTRLTNETQFANEAAAIEAIKPVVKTKSVTIQRGERKVELANESERTEMVNEIIEEICTEKKWDRKKDYSKAFNEAQRRHPALFEAMKAPELNIRKR